MIVMLMSVVTGFRRILRLHQLHAAFGAAAGIVRRDFRVHGADVGGISRSIGVAMRSVVVVVGGCRIGRGRRGIIERQRCAMARRRRLRRIGVGWMRGGQRRPIGLRRTGSERQA